MTAPGAKQKVNLPKGEELVKSRCPFHASADATALEPSVRKESALPVVGEFRWAVKERTFAGPLE